MANQVQLELLKKGVDAWNEWRKNNPSIEIDLSHADLKEAILCGANLRGANLSYINLSKADLSYINLSYVNLSKADLSGANLSRADLNEANLSGANLIYVYLFGAYLGKANLSKVDLSGANLINTNLSQAVLSEANLSKADLSEAVLNGANLSHADMSGAKILNANLVRSDFSKANITGAQLYGTARDDWKIEGIICDYVYWDEKGKIRTPQDRDFKPSEFEELYKQLPTFDYFFENSFRPIDAVLMSRIVDEINQKNPEFELKLDSFHSRGQPHAKFTVLHKDFIEESSKMVHIKYSLKRKTLEGKEETIEMIFNVLADKPEYLKALPPMFGGDFILGDKMGDIKIGDVKGQVAIGNEITQADQGSQITITKDISNDSSPEEFIGFLNYLLQELKKQKISDEIKAEIEYKLKGAQIQATKQENKDKVAEKLKSALDVLKNTGALAAESAAFGGMIGKAIEWCGHMVTGL